jgi:Protein kinase domain
MPDADGSARTLPHLEPGSMFAGYRIEGMLDRGGMGIVYKALDPDLDRAVALKIIAPEHTRDPTAVARFKSEARLAASLEHPNIVPVHRGGEHDGVLYLAMRYVSGTNLREIINAGPMPLPRVADIITKVGDALDAAHERGLVHRDVKPANILITNESGVDRVYLTDFGLTKHLGSIGDLTHTGSWVGTPDYVAPEQIQGLSVDRRADVYSLGCVVYEMLTGQVAYPKDSHMAKLWAHVTDPPPLPRERRPDLVPEWDAVVARATAKDLEERYATAGDLAAGVREALAAQEAKQRRSSQQQTRLADAGADSTGADTAAERLTRHGGAVPTIGPRGASTSGAVAASSSDETRAAGSQPAAAVGTTPPGGGSGGGNPERGDGRRPGRRGLLAAALAALAVLVAVAVVIIAGSGGKSSGGGSKPAQETANTSFERVPFNNTNRSSGGDVKVVFDDPNNPNVGTVTLTSTALLNDAPHLMHIHSGKAGTCPPGKVASLHNGHQVITAHDGAPYYGPPQTSLTQPGFSTGTSSVAVFARYTHQGNIDYHRRINFGGATASAIRQHNAVVVVHGIDYNKNGKYDAKTIGFTGKSFDAKGAPLEETAPALCGPLKPVPISKGSTQARNGSGTVYMAALAPARGFSSTLVSLVCALPGVPEQRR